MLGALQAQQKDKPLLPSITARTGKGQGTDVTHEKLSGTCTSTPCCNAQHRFSPYVQALDLARVSVILHFRDSLSCLKAPHTRHQLNNCRERSKKTVLFVWLFFFSCKLSPSVLSPSPGRLGDAAQAQHCPAELCIPLTPCSRSATAEHQQAVPEQALPGDGTASKENYPAEQPGWQELQAARRVLLFVFPPPSPETLLEKILLSSPVMAASTLLSSISLVPS